MTSLPQSLARNVPAMGRLIDGLKCTLLGESQRGNCNCPAMRVRVKCARCGEIISSRIDKANDLLDEFDASKSSSDSDLQPVGYVLHKEVVGRKCQNLVHFVMHFNAARRLTGHEIHGGEFVDWTHVE